MWGWLKPLILLQEILNKVKIDQVNLSHVPSNNLPWPCALTSQANTKLIHQTGRQKTQLFKRLMKSVSEKTLYLLATSQFLVSQLGHVIFSISWSQRMKNTKSKGWKHASLCVCLRCLALPYWFFPYRHVGNASSRLCSCFGCWVGAIWCLTRVQKRNSLIFFYRKQSHKQTMEMFLRLEWRIISFESKKG